MTFVRISRFLIPAIALVTIALAAAPAHADPTEPPGPIARLQETIRERGLSAPVLYDLGQAQRAAGQLGPAIASLERARLLSPRDERIRDALAGLRQEAGLSAPEPSRAHQAASVLSMREWAWLGIGAVGSMGLAIVAVGTARRRRRMWAGLLALGTAAAAVATTAALVQSDRLDRAIVLSDGVIARRSPFSEARPVFSLPEGDSVTVAARHGDYLRVAHRQGQTGWVRADQVDPLVIEAADRAR